MSKEEHRLYWKQRKAAATRKCEKQRREGRLGPNEFPERLVGRGEFSRANRLIWIELEKLDGNRNHKNMECR
jgi:hypothetical protein